MADPEDFALYSGPRQPPPSDNPSGAWLWVATAAAVVVIGAIAFWFFRPAPAEPEAEEATAEAARPAETPDAVEPPAGAPLDLPPLAESDTFVRRLIEGLSSRPELAVWLATDGLVRNLVVVVDNIAEGVSPTKHLAAFRPSQPFRATGNEETLAVDPGSYTRYNALADSVDSLDVRGTVEIYRKLRPLFDQAHRELGYPDGNFDVALQRAISHLLATPDLPADAQLTSHVESYRYADPKLESLSAAQKQLLRMGPRNVRLVKNKLRDILQALGFEERT
jgi:hypothetical protein